MTVYLTWPKATGDFAAAAAAGEVLAICAERASMAASRRAMGLSAREHTYCALVVVMPAHQLGGHRERPRCYVVRFSRGIKSVEAQR